MADWDTTDYKKATNGLGSRQSSLSSSHSDNKENTTYNHENSQADDSSLILSGGSELSDESRTDLSPAYSKNNNMNFPEIPPKQLTTTKVSTSGTAKAKAANSPYTAPSIDSVPVENFTIPSDANISSFTSNQLANFLMCLKVEDRIISHLHRKSVDGKRFAKFKDSELESLGLNNPVVVFFKNKSNVKVKGKGPFML